jgi:hypothetical protein
VWLHFNACYLNYCNLFIGLRWNTDYTSHIFITYKRRKPSEFFFNSSSIAHNHFRSQQQGLEWFDVDPHEQLKYGYSFGSCKADRPTCVCRPQWTSDRPWTEHVILASLYCSYFLPGTLVKSLPGTRSNFSEFFTTFNANLLSDPSRFTRFSSRKATRIFDALIASLRWFTLTPNN